MRGDVHVRFSQSAGAKLPRATQPFSCRSVEQPSRSREKQGLPLARCALCVKTAQHAFAVDLLVPAGERQSAGRKQSLFCGTLRGRAMNEDTFPLP
jgi:hypothetical protein